MTSEVNQSLYEEYEDLLKLSNISDWNQKLTGEECLILKKYFTNLNFPWLFLAIRYYLIGKKPFQTRVSIRN